MTPLVTLVLLIVAVLLGLLPGKIASDRNHANATAIMVCGLVGLVVWPAWIVALVWAFTGKK